MSNKTTNTKVTKITKIQQSMRQGACGRPGLARSPRPTRGTSLLEGGKSNGVRRKERTGLTRPLGRWLLSLGKGAEGPGAEAIIEVEQEGSLGL